MKPFLPPTRPLVSTRLLTLLLAAAMAAFPLAARAQVGALTTLVNFTNANGGAPDAALIQGSDGNFYGTTSGGGTGSDGTVFQLTPDGTLTTLVTFTGSNGILPSAGLIEDNNGNFYGTTEEGGATGVPESQFVPSYGTLFQISSSGTLTTLDRFTGSTGHFPSSGLILGNDGNYYGATGGNATTDFGTIFRVTPAGVLTTVFTFTGSNGSHPNGVIQASDGNFYGTTQLGGVNNDGTVFQLTPAGVLTTLLSFNGTNGLEPEAGLIQGSDGNLYGTTAGNGKTSDGTVFQITTSGTLSTLFTFTGANGNLPSSALIEGSDGNFYGTTQSGGASNDGTVFQLTPAGVLTTLVTFTGTNGSAPAAGLIEGDDGNYYGTTSAGGSGGSGTVFQMAVVYPPVITPAFGPSGTVGQPFTYQIGATNQPMFDVVGLPAGLTLTPSTGVISGTPSMAGSYPVNVTASNAAGSDMDTLTLTIAPLPLPVISSPTTATGQAGVFFGYRIIASHVPGNYGATGLPAGLTLNSSTGDISGIPAAPGTSQVTLTATNPSGTVSQILTLTIAPAVPVITSPAGVSGQVGQPFSYLIGASNVPATFGATGLPAGLSLNTMNGLITGMPTTAASTLATITATNAGGTGSAALTFLITSSAPAAIPSITSPGDATGQVGQAFSYQVTASNSPSSFSAMNLPAGLTIDPNKGLITGMPTASGSFSPMVSAINGKGTGTATVTMTIAPAQPDIQAVHILSPQTPITISASTAINLYARVDVIPGTLDGVSLYVTDDSGATPTDMIGSFTLPRSNALWTPPQPGNYHLNVQATDVNGGSAIASSAITVTNAPPPKIQLMGGLDNQTFAAGSSIMLVASAVDASGNPLQSVQFYADDVPIGSPVVPGTNARASGGPRTRQEPGGNPLAEILVTLENAEALITAQGTDSNGTSGVSNGSTVFTKTSSSIVTCSIGSPTEGAVIAANSAGATTVGVTAADSGATLGPVMLYVDSQSVGTLTTPPFNFSLPALQPGMHTLFAMATDAASGVSTQSTPITVTATTGTVHPVFFSGEASVGQGVYYLVFPDGNLFGYYNYQFFPYLYHYDLGFEYVIDAKDGVGGLYLFDFTSNHFWYTSPVFPFPYLFDFGLNAFLDYLPGTPAVPGHYSSNPRYFANLTTGKIITQ